MSDAAKIITLQKDWLIDLTSKLSIGQKYVSAELAIEMESLRDKVTKEITERYESS